MLQNYFTQIDKIKLFAVDTKNEDWFSSFL